MSKVNEKAEAYKEAIETMIDLFGSCGIKKLEEMALLMKLKIKEVEARYK